MLTPMEAAEKATLQSEDVRGEMIEYWLPPMGRQDFEGRDLVSEEEAEPIGPYVLCDSRCNHGTLTDAEVFEYVVGTHGVPPLMFMRTTWWDGKEDEDASQA